MKLKRARESADTEPASSSGMVDDFAARLAQHGEAFMQMFEDADEMPPPPKRAAIDPDQSASSSSDSEAQDDEVKLLPKVETFADVWSDGSASRHRRKTHSKQASQQDGMSSKAERRRFMSGKAADVHHKPALDQQHQKPKRKQNQQGRQIGVADQPLSRDDFLNMQKEVQQVGASALDRKARKRFDALQLQSVHAAPQKPGRLSAAIGKGMARKQAARDQKAHEEAIASGMIKLKGSGKKRAAPSSIEKGLLEDGGLFKAGMLRVKGPMTKGAKFKKAPINTKRAFSSGKIGDLNSNSQKAWNKAQQRTAKPSSRKPRR